MGRRKRSVTVASVWVGACVLVSLDPVPCSAAEPPCVDYSTHIRRLGAVTVPGGVADVAVVDGTMFAGASAGGLLIYDVSQAREPVLLATLETLAPSYDLCIEDGYCYLAVGPGGLKVIDVRDPERPALVGSMSGPASVEGVAVSGAYAYLGGGTDGLYVVDVSDPAAPAVVAHLDTPGHLTNLALRDEKAILCDGSAGLHVADVSEPAAPRIEATVTMSRPVTDLDVVGPLVFVAASDLHIVDVTDPLQPTIVVSIPGRAVSVTVEGELAFVSTLWVAGSVLKSGVIVYDVADPSAPELIGGSGTDGAASSAVCNGVLYVASRVDVDVVDVTNPASPPVLSTVATRGWPTDFSVQHGYGFTVSCFNSSYIMEVVDFRDPVAPLLLPGTVGLDFVHGFAVQGRFAYVADLSGLRVIDIGNPAAPRVVALAELPFGAFDVAVGGDFAFVAGYTDFLVIDVGDPAVPRVVASLPVPGVTMGVGFMRGFAVVAVNGPPDHAMVVDVRDPARPEVASTLDLGIDAGSLARVTVAGGHAYLTGSTRVLVTDVRDPFRPRLVATIEARYAQGVDIDDGYAYITPGYPVVIDVRSPAQPKVIGELFVPLRLSWRARVQEDILYVSGPWGISVVPRQCRGRSSVAESVALPGSRDDTVLPALTLGGPNPFSGQTAFHVRLPGGESGELAVYAVTGRLIRRLGRASSSDGRHEIVWDGKDDRGDSVASGTYFVRLNGQHRTAVEKVVRITGQ